VHRCSEPYLLSVVVNHAPPPQNTPAPPPGAPLPEKPTRQMEQAVEPFDGVLTERHTSADGSEYVRVAFGTGAVSPSGKVDDPSSIVDAEFLFLSGGGPKSQGGDSVSPESTAVWRRSISASSHRPCFSFQL
jgi:hypothetical protein